VKNRVHYPSREEGRLRIYNFIGRSIFQRKPIKVVDEAYLSDGAYRYEL